MKRELLGPHTESHRKIKREVNIGPKWLWEFVKSGSLGNIRIFYCTTLGYLENKQCICILHQYIDINGIPLILVKIFNKDSLFQLKNTLY